LSCFESQEIADIDRIRACIEKNELPSFALVQSICSGELLSFVASTFFCLSLGFVLEAAPPPFIPFPGSLMYPVPNKLGHQDIGLQLGSTQGGKEEEAGMQRATS
jgi:hypothetical protein